MLLELLKTTLQKCHLLAQVVVQFTSNARSLFLLCGDQPPGKITEPLFYCFTFRNVLNCTVELHDTSRGIPLRFTSSKEPSTRAIWADHLKIEFVGCCCVQRFFHDMPQPFPTFGCEKFLVFLIAGCG